MNNPTLVEMLKSGCHFGHRTSKWHPNMAPYIFTTRNNVHIINLEETERKLAIAVNAVRELASQGKVILFVGTKRQASPIIEKYAKECGMPFMAQRWLGGLFTNFKEVSHVARKLTKLKTERDSGGWEKYTKKEALELEREVARLENMAGGIEIMMQRPDAVFIVDLHEEKTAVREATQVNIPIIAMCDTNVDPKLTAYPIPVNDDAIKSIELIVRSIAHAIIEGKNVQEKMVESTNIDGVSATTSVPDIQI